MLNDLDFNLKLGDLFSSVCNYVLEKSLNILFERRLEVIDLLNEVISEVCNKVF